MAESRQKQLERKRQKRAKRLKQRRVQAPPAVSFGTGLPKISERLVAFAGPLLDDAPETPEGWRSRLLVAALVWNGVVDAVPHQEIVAQLAPDLPSVDVPGLVSFLAQRKQDLYPADPRRILDIRTYVSGDRIHVAAASALTL
jgi:hypothetical protein